uniref:NADH dehydrogenase [ubiquinone] 1 alpha subcomplex subunit 6 n=1 Tax=Micromonas pusilla TaxID=38833 RepID=A0A7S0D1E4_MICPS|mmetsp:Transcript_13806/g.58056  ORF Transcript_13806/g.58056 Transcript_13806/m.58056 type:complete len:150 (+) Transcript_13806:147-596(+)|eukprot:CAMPEP_0203005792 /NCGR_PEP_ID=MMETSP1401-20130829/3276_1 /ASSEMBLY_ACC=CAM_ASM_000894 /TAXON_ID=38833 /ORGANISM="Micromonas pusilla, Strain CCAC1681" /LENGTH=149 /DNA_ID=CAMNT_0049747421 /DNA_START=130 /DNA_END=579 /DNA_ORIENTATION=+
MALRATVARLATSQGLSAPAGAPVFSASLPEAKARSRQFFREVCREVPWIMRTYWLEEVTTAAQLRSRLANEFRRASTDNPAVIDVMLFKGAQELVTVMAHHFQRHHLITKFVAPESNAIVKKTNKPQSKFLANFLSGKPTAPDGHHAY